MRLVASLASSPLAARARAISSWSTWPTWYTSAVCGLTQSTGAPGQGRVPFAALASTDQQEPTAGAVAGGFDGIGSSRLIHQTAPAAATASNPIATSLLRPRRATADPCLPNGNLPGQLTDPR